MLVDEAGGGQLGREACAREAPQAWASFCLCTADRPRGLRRGAAAAAAGLARTVAEHLSEALLVVVVAMRRRVVDAAHVDDDVAGCQHRRIAGAHDLRVLEGLGARAQGGR